MATGGNGNRALHSRPTPNVQTPMDEEVFLKKAPLVTFGYVSVRDRANQKIQVRASLFRQPAFYESSRVLFPASSQPDVHIPWNAALSPCKASHAQFDKNGQTYPTRSSYRTSCCSASAGCSLFNEDARGSESAHLAWVLPERIHQFRVIAAVAR